MSVILGYFNVLPASDINETMTTTKFSPFSPFSFLSKELKRVSTSSRAVQREVQCSLNESSERTESS